MGAQMLVNVIHQLHTIVNWTLILPVFVQNTRSVKSLHPILYKFIFSIRRIFVPQFVGLLKLRDHFLSRFQCLICEKEESVFLDVLFDLAFKRRAVLPTHGHRNKRFNLFVLKNSSILNLKGLHLLFDDILLIHLEIGQNLFNIDELVLEHRLIKFI